MSISEIIASCGFEQTGHCQACDLKARPEVREMCAADKCQRYGSCWACPPGCGDIENFQAAFDCRTSCYLVQTVAQLEDEFDIETMLSAEKLQKKRFFELNDKIKKIYPDAMMLSSGTCTICPECTYPDAPCRVPERAIASMEAAGLVVSDVCNAAGIPYNHGKNTIAYTGCVVL